MYNVVNAEDCVSKYSKVLVCAPSNAAVDELLRKLIKDGVFGEDGKRYVPSVVRLGPGIHENLREQYSLECLANKRALQSGLAVADAGRNTIDKYKREIVAETNVVYIIYFNSLFLNFYSIYFVSPFCSSLFYFSL